MFVIGGGVEEVRNIIIWILWLRFLKSIYKIFLERSIWNDKLC